MMLAPDPPQFPDGTTALSSSSFSEDGTRFAYGLSRGGSDWVTVYIRDVASGADLTLTDGSLEAVPFVKFSGLKWTHDGKGFFYCRYPAPPEVASAGTESGKAGTETAANRYAFVCYHKVGTNAAEDLLVYACPAQPNWRYGIDITDDGQYLLLTTVKGTDPVNRLYYCHLPTHWDAWVASSAGPASIPPGGVPLPQAPAGASPAPGGTYRYLPFVRAIDNFEAEYEVIANDGARFYLRTNLEAPRYRIIAIDFPADAQPGEPVCPGQGAPDAGATIDIDKPAGATPQVFDVVPQHEADVLDWSACVAGSALVLCYMRQVVNALQVRLLPRPSSLPALNPTAASSSSPSPALIHQYTEIPLPAPGTVGSFAGRRDQDTVFLKFTSFLHPGSILRVTFNDAVTAGSGAGVVKAVTLPGPVNAASSVKPVAAPASTSSLPIATVTPFWDTHLAGFDASSFEARQVFVPSKDASVAIPMFIVHKKGLLDTGPAPCLQYAYGGFNISLPPSFSPLRLAWLSECGGVFALANIRGGGELGEEWHKGGMRLSKQNCFDDMAACTQWLIDHKYTQPRKVAILGGSNGGLLTLAVALQRPDLYGAAVSQVPVADMMRFHKFTIGAAWRGEYGFAEDHEDDCLCMLKYSPLHNVKPPRDEANQLPSILITTADHDDRVVPLHSFKMAAELQAVAGASPNQHRPLLIRIESKAGHGAGKPTSKILDEYADVYAFVASETGATWKA